VEVKDDCGRTTLEWIAVDEACVDVDDPGYLDAFRVPMFRDGVLIGDRLYAADATHVWVLDVSDEKAPVRRGLVTGLGHPIALGAHAGHVLVAAGEAGLVVLDPTAGDVPDVIATLALPGPALDVSVESDRALVAMGAAGIAVIDLVPTLASPAAAPLLVKTIPTPGFAVGVSGQGSLGVVAACDTVAVLDLAAGSVVGQTWLSAYDTTGLLVMPARDVELVGSEAFVASGRYGSTLIDVADPVNPFAVGQCMVDELTFYASGVRVQAGTLYVAGGEWGVLPVDVAQPGACKTFAFPSMPPVEGSDDDCDVIPPWQSVPWKEVYDPPPPPPPGKDPVQTLPAGDVLFAFGDARRLGIRAVEVRSTTENLAHVGRYDEPNLIRDLAAGGGRVLVVGQGAALYTAGDDTTLLVPDTTPLTAKDGVAAVFLAAGQWVVATETSFQIEGLEPMPLGEPISARGLAAREQALVFASSQGAWIFDTTTQSSSLLSAAEPAELPPSVLARADGVYMAAPEWERTVRLDATGATSLVPNGVFGAEEILDANLWREGLPRRLLADSPAGVVEIASLGALAGLTLHNTDGSSTKLALPGGTYMDAAASGDTVYVAMADRNVYRSALLTIKLEPTQATVIHSETFTGVATALAVDGGRLYLADSDRGIRVYSVGANTPEFLGVVELVEAP
jgi:hypothetical protein